MADAQDPMWTVMVDVFGEEDDALAVRDVIATALKTYPDDDPRLAPGDERVTAVDPGRWLALLMDGRTVLELRDALQRDTGQPAPGVLDACEEWLAQARCPDCGQPFDSCMCG